MSEEPKWTLYFHPAAERIDGETFEHVAAELFKVAYLTGYNDGKESREADWKTGSYPWHLSVDRDVLRHFEELDEPTP